MSNPFIKTSDSGHEYIDRSASINRMTIKDLPLYGVDNEVQGKSVSQIFSTGIIAADIRQNSEKLRLNCSDLSDGEVISGMMKALADGNEQALRLSVKYGRRLGLILLSLKTGLKANRAARPDWSDECWDYWGQLKNIILVGGLTSGILGSILKSEALWVFEQAGIEPYNFIMFDNASYIGVMGCASALKERDGSFLVFDFGQTSLKRSVIKKRSGEIIETRALKSLPSKFMSTQFQSKDEERDTAMQLSSYLVKRIFDTVNEIPDDINPEIIISIANYVCDGVLLHPSGGYSKLSLICPNYAEYLANELSGLLRRTITVSLIHDATAAALYFADYTDCACITLGTAFGIGFPETRI